MEEQDLEGCVWGVVLDREKLSLTERITMNKGAYWVQEEKDGAIYVCSYRLCDVNNVVSEEYDLDLRIDDDLLERKNWEKYRKRVPGLIADLEAAERIAYEANEKYGTNIKLIAGHKPYLETGFDARGISEAEKLHDIEKHARAIHETWGIWHMWTKNVGREIYRKTTKKRMGREKFIEEVMSRLRDITGVTYFKGEKGPGTLWIRVGDTRDKDNIAANRGIWFIKEIRDSIVMMSDNIETINARSMEEYNLLQQTDRSKVAIQEVDSYKETLISPELIQRITEQVGEKYKVKIHVRKDKPVIETTFHTSRLRPYGKLYEIEKHAEALAEAWNGIKGISQSRKAE